MLGFVTNNMKIVINEFELNLNGSINPDNVKIIAFVNTHQQGVFDPSIVNVQQVKLGETANWD